MPLKFRQWCACFLMVLLPLQAFAGTQAVSCADWMAHCPGMTNKSDACCDHSASAKAGDGKQITPGQSTNMASCAGATTCAPVAVAAALPPAESPLILAATPDSWLDREHSSFQSHIPDGLRRPPRFLA